MYDIGQQVGSLAIIVLLSSIGGTLFGMMGGFTVPQMGRVTKGFKVAPLFEHIRFPPVVGMIVFSCIARNFFGSIVDAFPTIWAQYIRMSAVAVFLTRGGLLVTFRGKGIIVLVMAFIPCTIEATSHALIGMGIFNMPIEVSYAMGFAASSVGTALVAALALRLNDLGYGRKKGIGPGLVASCTFDNIISLTSFGICRTIVMENALLSKGKTGVDQRLTIGFLFVQIISGAIFGFLLGLTGKVLTVFDKYRWCLYVKCIYSITLSIGMIIAAEVYFPINGVQYNFDNAKFIACLIFGYTLQQVWGDKKPTDEIANLWFYIQPILFGTIGAALLFNQIRPSDVGKAFVLVIAGQCFRYFTVLLISMKQGYTIKERVFLATSYIPKSTAVASVAGVIYTDFEGMGDEFSDYKAFGLQIQTTTILAIVLTMITGCFLIDFSGPKLLHNDLTDVEIPQDLEEKEKKINKVVPEDLGSQESGPGKGDVDCGPIISD